eukprot:scaffold5096_cov116-Isochrysis_galbana.AAC.3
MPAVEGSPRVAVVVWHASRGGTRCAPMCVLQKKIDRKHTTRASYSYSGIADSGTPYILHKQNATCTLLTTDAFYVPFWARRRRAGRSTRGARAR